MPLPSRFNLGPAQPPEPPRSQLQSKIRNAKASGVPEARSEIARITALPIDFGMGEDEMETFQSRRILTQAYRDGFRLFPVQANALAAFEKNGGLFAPIGVGWGKTLITLMIAEHAFAKRMAERILLCVPSQVYVQLTERDIAWARRRVPLTMPIIGLGSLTLARRRQLAASGRRGLYILPYSCLSTKDATRDDKNPGTLFSIAPQLLILDEAHLVKSRKAARTRRLRDYIVQHEPRMVVLSGTITSKSVQDYHYLMRGSLGDQSPLPLSTQMAAEWGAVIDSDAAPTDRQTGPLQPLVRWARGNFPDQEFDDDITSFRRAYKMRLTSAPGVVATGDADIGVSLTLCNHALTVPSDENGETLKRLIRGVEELWQTPDGDEIEYAIHTFRWLYELHSGFYNSLVWPQAEEFARRRSISVQRAEELIRAGKEHHVALQDYHRVLRGFLENAPPGIDTPMLAGYSMSRHKAQHVGQNMYRAWRAAKDLEVPNMAERDSIAVRISPFKIERVVKWAEEHRKVGGIIWVYNTELGLWAKELLEEAGIDVLYCPAGDQANRDIVEPTNGNRIVVASIVAHGTGKNLQHFQNQIYLQWPRPAALAEQSLGRTHRNGQQADELVVHTLHSSEFDYMTFGACLNDAVYIQQSTGTRQKIVYCNYDPMPKIYGSEFLRERGFNNMALNQEQRQLLQELFGANS